MPKDDIKDLYEQAEQHLKAKAVPRRATIVDGAPPPQNPGPAPKPMAVPRPAPKKVEAPEPELLSEPEASAPLPLPSHFPESEAPTAALSSEARRRQASRRRAPKPAVVPSLPPLDVPLSKEDVALAKKSRSWNPPDWLVAIAKWVAPPIMLCLMAVAYWFQGQVALASEQTQALSEVRKQKDAAYEQMKKDLAAIETKLGTAQAERDAHAGEARRWKALYEQRGLTVTPKSEEKP